MVQVQALYGGYCQNPASAYQNQVIDSPKILYTGTPQGQVQHDKRSIAYQDSSQNMNCFEQLSPMLGNDYAQMSLGRGRGSFAEFSNARHVFKDFKYHPSNESAPNSLTSATSSTISASSYSDTSSFGQSLDISRTSPDTVYNCYSPKSKPSSSQFPASSSTRNVQQMDARAKWWPGSTKSAKDPSQMAYDLSMSFDGLPRYTIEQQPTQYSGPWSMTSTPASKWTSQLIESKTISPKALTLNASSASLASSGSSRASTMALSVSSTTTSLADGDLPSQENLVVVEPQQPVRRPRQTLPSAGPVFRSIPVPSNDVPPSKNLRKRSVKAVEPESHARRSSPPSKLAPTATSRVQRSRDDSSKSTAPQKVVTKPAEPATSASEPSWVSSSVAIQAEHHRDARDDFLVKSKMAGMSYKDIRLKGNFTEAESTLRGRFRTLTKQKAARVRKPEWSDNDVSLLRGSLQQNDID